MWAISWWFAWLKWNVRVRIKSMAFDERLKPTDIINLCSWSVFPQLQSWDVCKKRKYNFCAKPKLHDSHVQSGAHVQKLLLEFFNNKITSFPRIMHYIVFSWMRGYCLGLHIIIFLRLIKILLFLSYNLTATNARRRLMGMLSKFEVVR